MKAFSCLLQDRYYRLYRQATYPFYPVVLNIEEFESGLCDFLRCRGELCLTPPPSGAEEVVHGKDLTWLGLLFALLAAGCQFSDLSFTEKGLTSRVFGKYPNLFLAQLTIDTLVCCSFECLRLMNFYVRPTLASVQTLLVLGSVIQNDLNPGVSWCLLGTYCKL